MMERMDGVMEKWGKKLDAIAYGFAMATSGIAFVGMVLLISLNAVCRYFFTKSLNWAEELTYLFCNWSVFLGVAVVYRFQGLTAIDLFVNRFPDKLRKLATILNYSLIFLITSSLVVWGWQFSMRAWIRKSPALRIPYFYYDVSIPIACLILAGYALTFLVKTLRNEDVAETALEERV